MCVRNFVSLSLSVLAFLGVATAPEPTQPPPTNCQFVVEYLHLQDFSSSYAEDFPVLQGQLPLLVAEIEKEFPGSKLGAGSFVDKAMEPFGYPYEGPWFTGDWELNITTQISGGDHLPKLLELLQIPLGGGNDWAENQLGALFYTAKHPTLANWTTNTHDEHGFPIARLIVMSTDSIFHIAGDGYALGLTNNTGTGDLNYANVDYPTFDQVSEALKSRNIYTVFLLGNTTGEDLVKLYGELLVELDVPGDVYPLDANSTDVVEQMKKAFETFNNRTCLKHTVDIVYSQDTTWSYRNDMGHFQKLTEDMTVAMNQEYIGCKFGLTTFADKPFYPFGHAGSGDFCYKKLQALSINPQNVHDAASLIKVVSGVDWWESQLDGCMSSVLEPTMGWRAGGWYNGFKLYRIVALATDAGFHIKGDAAKNGLSLAVHSGGMVNCLEEDYPDEAQLAAALIKKGVHPLFVPTSDIAFMYKKLVKRLKDNYGIIGAVSELKDYGGLPSAIVTGSRRLIQMIEEEAAKTRFL